MHLVSEVSEECVDELEAYCSHFDDSENSHAVHRVVTSDSLDSLHPYDFDRHPSFQGRSHVDDAKDVLEAHSKDVPPPGDRCAEQSRIHCGRQKYEDLLFNDKIFTQPPAAAPAPHAPSYSSGGKGGVLPEKAPPHLQQPLHAVSPDISSILPRYSSVDGLSAHLAAAEAQQAAPEDTTIPAPETTMKSVLGGCGWKRGDMPGGNMGTLVLDELQLSGMKLLEEAHRSRSAYSSSTHEKAKWTPTAPAAPMADVSSMNSAPAPPFQTHPSHLSATTAPMPQPSNQPSSSACGDQQRQYHMALAYLLGGTEDEDPALSSGSGGGSSTAALWCGAQRLSPVGHVGTYSPTARRARIANYMEKRKRRVWTKKVKYDGRKSFADSRMRVKGRFVKKDDEDYLKELVSCI